MWHVRAPSDIQPFTRSTVAANLCSYCTTEILFATPDVSACQYRRWWPFVTCHVVGRGGPMGNTSLKECTERHVNRIPGHALPHVGCHFWLLRTITPLVTCWNWIWNCTLVNAPYSAWGLPIPNKICPLWFDQLMFVFSRFVTPWSFDRSSSLPCWCMPRCTWLGLYYTGQDLVLIMSVWFLSVSKFWLIDILPNTSSLCSLGCGFGNTCIQQSHCSLTNRVHKSVQVKPST